MTASIAIQVPDEPECWDSCGTCRSELLEVVELLVSPGDRVDLYQPLLVVEAYKTDMEVLSSASGVVEQLLVIPGDEVSPGDVVALVRPL
ncbi:biotin/lipoyl-containing protein [Motiliproteus sediminis]|uniref:biotin/lipoyl-containing protein n=1 Tax=Motiliproteus sediminis TaxID=1468178 RepID=UPI001AEF5F51|nr:biotin/lipoyl-containing protein [Motiliproteus sediminis]